MIHHWSMSIILTRMTIMTCAPYMTYMILRIMMIYYRLIPMQIRILHHPVHHLHPIDLFHSHIHCLHHRLNTNQYKNQSPNLINLNHDNILSTKTVNAMNVIYTSTKRMNASNPNNTKHDDPLSVPCDPSAVFPIVPTLTLIIIMREDHPY